MLLQHDDVPDYPAYQTISNTDGTECPDSQVSTEKLNGNLHGSETYDFDQDVVYICGGKDAASVKSCKQMLQIPF